MCQEQACSGRQLGVVWFCCSGWKLSERVAFYWIKGEVRGWIPQPSLPGLPRTFPSKYLPLQGNVAVWGKGCDSSRICQPWGDVIGTYSPGGRHVSHLAKLRGWQAGGVVGCSILLQSSLKLNQTCHFTPVQVCMEPGFLSLFGTDIGAVWFPKHCSPKVQVICILRRKG